MATETQNYNLTKPAANDYYNVEEFNENTDIIDGILFQLNTAVNELTNLMSLLAANGKVTHKHAAGDIDSGVLSAERGGTGVSSLSELANAISLYLDKAKIRYGSYVGTGTCGSNNPTSLTFDFKPKVVFLDEQISFSHVVTFIQGCSQAGTESSSLDVYWSGNSVSWVYNVNDDTYADRQMNAATMTYYYVALC